MKIIVDECVGCTDIGLYCIGDTCPNRNVTRHCCDSCGSETKLYHYDNLEMCEVCLLEQFDVVEGTDW